MRRLAQQRGLLLAFIALDNPAQSLLDMQSVTFAGGKCVTARGACLLRFALTRAFRPLQADVQAVPGFIPVPILRAGARRVLSAAHAG